MLQKQCAGLRPIVKTFDLRNSLALKVFNPTFEGVMQETVIRRHSTDLEP